MFLVYFQVRFSRVLRPELQDVCCPQLTPAVALSRSRDDETEIFFSLDLNFLC